MSPSKTLVTPVCMFACREKNQRPWPLFIGLFWRLFWLLFDVSFDIFWTFLLTFLKPKSLASIYWSLFTSLSTEIWTTGGAAAFRGTDLDDLEEFWWGWKSSCKWQGLLYTWTYTYKYIWSLRIYSCMGVATISKLLQITGLFCRI